MKKRTLIPLVIVAILTLLEVFYFRFHTYFQRTEVNEALPSANSTPSGSFPSPTPRTIVSGEFVEVDAIHKGSGTARIIEQDGKQYVRFENFQVTNGPDLYVYLSESTTPTNDLKSLDKYLILGSLKGNVGDQNYEIPEPFRGYHTVIIWCQKFGVLFSYAIMR